MARERRATNAGDACAREEGGRLPEAFEAGIDVKELAAQHGRTTGVIESPYNPAKERRAESVIVPYTCHNQYSFLPERPTHGLELIPGPREHRAQWLSVCVCRSLKT